MLYSLYNEAAIFQASYRKHKADPNAPRSRRAQRPTGLQADANTEQVCRSSTVKDNDQVFMRIQSLSDGRMLSRLLRYGKE